MLETMYSAPGIGLAAVQVGILKRLIVIDISKEEEKNPLLINPEIITKSKTTSIYEEGCLSLPGHFAEIERPADCLVKYVDYNGKKRNLKQADFYQLAYNMRWTILMGFYLSTIYQN